ncbi:MAG TPA: dockerin type I domain-containing protein, partial [Tepidisphaeraceae bacterium]|nr:dockerin type I domain-containing protein [Tepidisphaeraceae bacterium]
GEVDLGGAVTGNNSMTVDGTSALGVANITKFDGTSLIASRPLTFTSGTEVVDSSLTAKGVTLSFPAATTLVRDNLTASTAGQLLFPAATSYSNSSTGNGYSIQASGTGSRINLASLTSFAGSSGRYPYGTTNVTADTGGEIDLAGQIGGGVTITSDGAASALNFHTTTSFTGNPTITSKNNGPIYNYGSFSTDNVTINLTGSTLTNQPGAVIYGSGTITGNLSNAGYVAPGASPFDAAGKLTVIGDYSQTSSGAFRAELGGTTFGTLYDRLSVTGTANLAGTEDIYSIGGYLPTAGDLFITVLAANVTGTFSSLTGNNFGNGVGVTPIYNANEGVLTAEAMPAIATLSINGGAAQRSMDTLLTVKFSQAIALNSAMSLLRRANDGGAPTAMTFASSSPDGGVTWNLTFPNAITGSLPDGVYDLTIDGSAVTLASNGQALGNGSQRFTFHRLFGDINGDGTVNLTDYRLFKNAFLTTNTDPNWNVEFDYNGDGVVNLVDYRAFKANYLKAFMYSGVGATTNAQADARFALRSRRTR